MIASRRRNRNAPQKHVWRVEIVLLSADGYGTVEIMSRTQQSKTCVWRWQERFMEEGFKGLLRDKTRPSRIPPLGQVIDKVVALTATEPRHEATSNSTPASDPSPCALLTHLSESVRLGHRQSAQRAGTITAGYRLDGER
jgi:hypothetical protein